EIILDVTHNPHAARALADNLRKLEKNGKTVAVFSMLADKDIAGVVTATAAEIDIWYLSPVDHSRGADVTHLIEAFDETVRADRIRTFQSLAEAFKQACNDAGKNDRIIVFGSFFTVAEVMRLFPAQIASHSSGSAS